MVPPCRCNTAVPLVKGWLCDLLCIGAPCLTIALSRCTSRHLCTSPPLTPVVPVPLTPPPPPHLYRLCQVPPLHLERHARVPQAAGDALLPSRHVRGAAAAICAMPRGMKHTRVCLRVHVCASMYGCGCMQVDKNGAGRSCPCLFAPFYLSNAMVLGQAAPAYLSASHT